MKKKVVVIGDVEMGAGTLTDDFISDKALSELIRILSKQEEPIDLILNGDTFDFLKCPYIDQKGNKSFPDHITEQISRQKVLQISKAHQRVFDAWKEFVKNKKNSLTFIIGNHDPDLIYPGVQEQIYTLLKRKENIFFKTIYQQHRIHVEHGHKYDLMSHMDFDKFSINHKGNTILNLPWISLGVIRNFLSIKEEHPFLERIKPLKVMFSVYPLISKKLSKRFIQFLVKSLFYHPWRYYNDPTYDFPRILRRELYSRLKNFNWEIGDLISSFKKNLKHNDHNKLYIFGHEHKKYVEEISVVILEPDTWRDEYILDSKLRILEAKKKYYVEITINENDDLQWQLNCWPIKRSLLKFDEVIKDEFAFLHHAAKEEEYSFPDLSDINLQSLLNH